MHLPGRICFWCRTLLSYSRCWDAGSVNNNVNKSTNCSCVNRCRMGMTMISVREQIASAPRCCRYGVSGYGVVVECSSVHFWFVPRKSSSCVTPPGKEFPLRSSVRLCLLLSLTAASENNAVVFKT